MKNITFSLILLFCLSAVGCSKAPEPAPQKKKVLNDYGFMKEIHKKYGTPTFKDLIKSSNDLDKPHKTLTTAPEKE